MPKIPTAETYIPRSGVVDGPRFRPSLIGPALRSAGQDIGEAGRFLEQRNEEDARIWNAKVGIEIENEGLSELQRIDESGEDQNGLTPRFVESMGKRFDEAAAEAPNDQARAYLELNKAQILGSLGRKATEQEGRYRVVKTVSSLDDLIGLAANTVATDPGQFAKQWVQVRGVLDATRLPTEARARLEDRARQIGASAVAGMIEANPYAAAKQLEGGEWDQYLDPNDRVSLYNSAQSGIKSREAEARARAAESRAIAAENASIYMSGFQDYAAYRAAGNPPDPKLEAKYSPAAIARLGVKGADEWAAKAADVQVQGDLMLALRSADTPAERAEIVAKALETTKSPENYQFNAGMAQTIETTARQFDKQLQETPGEVAATSSRVQDAIKAEDGPGIVSSMLGEQERLGVPPTKMVALPEAYADRLAAEIQTMPPEKQGEAVADLARTYGSFWPQVLKQIGAKLPDTVAIAATMPEGAGRVMLLQAGALPKADRNAGVEDTEAVNDALAADETLAALRSSLRPDLQSNGSAVYAQAENAVRDLAYSYIRSGMSEGDAVAKAVADVTAETAFVETNGVSARIPVAEMPDLIEAGMEVKIDGFDPAVFDVPGPESGLFGTDAPQFYADKVRQNGTWVNDADGRGLLLWDGYNFVTKGGEPYLFSWDELRKAAPAP